jgi:hypothetical protein
MEEQGLLKEIVTRVEVDLQGLLEQVGRGKIGAASVEEQVHRILQATGVAATAMLLEAADRLLAQGQSVHDRRTRSVVSRFGALDVTRCRLTENRYPLDEALNLEGRHGWTLWVQEAASLLACEKGFESSSDLLERLLGISMSPPAIEQVAESAGRRVMALGQEPLKPAVSGVCKTLVIAADGCHAPERDGWHEVKVANIYANEHRVKTASGRGKLAYKQYLATLDDAAGFGRLLWQAAECWQAEKARRVVVMGDGAPWIWNLAAEHFPGALEIVDFYHAAEHLWAAGEALFGERSISGGTGSWVKHYRHHLRRGRVDLVIEALDRAGKSQAAKLPPERQTLLRRNLEYFKTNRDRMRYDRYKRMHLPIGTGAVEGSCKFVVQERFKLPGSRWSDAGLRAMLALKQLRLNGQWDCLWRPKAA